MGQEIASYASPRVTGEILDCALPVTFDTYSKCSYNCLYCFSWYQKTLDSVGGKKHKDYQSMPLKIVNMGGIVKLFEGKTSNPFIKSHIARQKVIQFGGLADQFDEHERKHGATLEILKYLRGLKYPLTFSTKAIWWLKDDRYREIFKDMDNWNLKISIINLDEHRASKIEKGAPKPVDRVNAFKNYDMNKGGATLRLRPFIIGLSDVNDEYLELIKMSASQGISAVSCEFLCLENRATQQTKTRYFEISKVIGFDLHKYYRANSENTGLLRLNRGVKLPYVKKMKELCDKLNLRLYFSDSHVKDYSCNGCCCGLPDSWNYERSQYTEALMIAKEKGFVKFGDFISEELRYSTILRDVNYHGKGAEERSKYVGMSIYEYFRKYWNDLHSHKGIYKYFYGILSPKGRDEEGNIIFYYAG